VQRHRNRRAAQDPTEVSFISNTKTSKTGSLKITHGGIRFSRFWGGFSLR